MPPSSVDPTRPRPFGRTGLAVTPICIGTSPLASMPGLYGYSVDAERAEATVEAVFDGPFTFLDTSNNYGAGSAEERIGAVLRRRGGVPDGFVLATKVDADPETGDFSGERVRRSADESLTRLGVESVPVLYLHDPEYHLTFEEAMAPRGAVEALVSLRDEGVTATIAGPSSAGTPSRSSTRPPAAESPSSTVPRTAAGCSSRVRTCSLDTPIVRRRTSSAVL
jgi:D-threo-aldose 1-dehydrogenase